MINADWLSLLHQHRAIAIIRVSNFDTGLAMAHAVAEAGMGLIEITWNSDRAGDLIAKLVSDLPNCQIGVGTILNCQDLENAIAAGAKFAFTPHVDGKIIQAAISQDVPIVSGALTPTEIMNAYSYGASSVKVFPVQSVGGIQYIQAIRPPLGEVPLIPTGGVTINNAKAYLEAGAVAIGISGELFPKDCITNQNWSGITQQAQRLLQVISDFRF